MAKIYHELGLLERPEVVETDRSSLVGAFVGQTEEQVMSKVREAVGGVLFIDEAYALKRAGQSGNDYGQAAIDTLVAAMTSGEYAGRFAVVLAGYPEEMRDFLKANPGLRSRFPESNHYLLADYTDQELLAIGRSIATANDYVLTEQAERALLGRLERNALTPVSETDAPSAISCSMPSSRRVQALERVPVMKTLPYSNKKISRWYKNRTQPLRSGSLRSSDCLISKMNSNRLKPVVDAKTSPGSGL